MKSDLQLQQDVLAELKWEPSVDAARIGVEVRDGVVTLAGHVASYGEKWNAERAALRVAGVKALAIEMDVNLPGSSIRNDGDIARTAQNVLQWMSAIHKDMVKVTVEDGWITLTGEVDWEYQRRAAEKAVRGLLGVKGVSDQINIKQSVTSGRVKAEIEAALKRRATADAQQIKVEVQGANVTLSGTTHTLPERNIAIHAAWATPGVWAVTDHVTIAY